MKTLPIILTTCIWLCCAMNLSAQSVGIGTTSPNYSALLDLSSTDKGILIPRMTTTQRNLIAVPAAGLMVYDADLMGFWYYNGTAWQSMNGPEDKWKMNGNTGTNSTHFLGTMDDQPMRFKLNNFKAGNWDGTNRNYSIGVGALDSITTGKGNIAIGSKALIRNKTQNGLVAVGDSSLYSNTTGVQNIALGSKALRSNSSGSRNTATGFQALSSNTGSGNTAVGNNALRLNTSGISQVAVGDSCLYSNTTGIQNTSVGSHALRKNTTGNENVANGSFAMFFNTTGSRNVANGRSAMFFNTTGFDNVASGFEALNANTTGIGNVANGKWAMRYNTTGGSNVASGFQALFNNTTGVGNVANGANAMNYNTTGFQNLANGYFSLYYNLTGAYNVANGAYALYRNAIGTRNSAFGYSADVDAGNLSNATAIGANALVAESNCLVLGSINGVNGATESVNVGIGTTSPNTRLHIVGGTDASYTNTSGYLVTGDVATSNIVMDDNEIMARNNGTAAPLYLQVSGGDLKIGSGVPSYKLEVGSSEAAKTGGGMWIATSDERLKKNIRSFEDGLDVVKQIRPVQFSYNGEAGIADDTSTFVGIIAQELKPVAPYMIGEFTYTAPDGQKENYMDYDGTAMTYILINAVKEQQAIIDSLKTEVAALKSSQADYNALNQQLTQIITTLHDAGIMPKEEK